LCRCPSQGGKEPGHRTTPTLKRHGDRNSRQLGVCQLACAYHVVTADGAEKCERWASSEPLGLPPGDAGRAFRDGEKPCACSRQAVVAGQQAQQQVAATPSNRPTARRWFFQFERLPHFGHSLTAAAKRVRIPKLTPKGYQHLSFEAGVFDRKKSCAQGVCWNILFEMKSF
jgi:hypothetical protein